MGVVLKAFDRELKRCVAIKVLSPHLAQSALAKKRFAREAQAAAAVVHPHVLAIHQVQAGGRLPFLVMPLVAGEVLGGGPETLGLLTGLLTAALGVGALGASLALAARRSVVGLSRVIALATGAFGLGMVGLALSRSLWLSLVVLLVTGFAMVAQMAASNTLVQAIVEEDKRGRVMSFYALAFVGTAPLGSLLSGCLASTVGSTATILGCGLVCVAGSLVFAALLPGFRKAVHPIYVRIGIVQDAAGIQAATPAPRPEPSTIAIPYRSAEIPAARRSAA
jgi:MFS family permease